MISSLHLKVLFWLAVGSWALLLVIDGQAITVSLLEPSSLVLSTIIVVMTVFEKWAWRWPLLYPWFVRTPNVLGVYKGEVNSHWVDPATGKQHEAIPAFLVIHQTLSTVYVRLYTAESESCSVLGSFVESPDGRTDLLFTYRNEPRLEVRSQSSIHYGGARLSIGQASDELKGSYWTDRQTIGTLDFRRVSRKTPHSFSECANL